MIILGIEIRKAPKKLSTEESFIETANKLTEIWKDSYEQRLNLVPWINWSTKSVLVAERGNIKFLNKEDRTND